MIFGTEFCDFGVRFEDVSVRVQDRGKRVRAADALEGDRVDPIPDHAHLPEVERSPRGVPVQ
eukprot:12960072-Heterocapsa_arctica.AAC.1